MQLMPSQTGSTQSGGISIVSDLQGLVQLQADVQSTDRPSGSVTEATCRHFHLDLRNLQVFAEGHLKGMQKPNTRIHYLVVSSPYLHD